MNGHPATVFKTRDPSAGPSPGAPSATDGDFDADLVRRTLAGEAPAFEALVERHAGVVYRVAARMVGPDDAEDVSQDAFLRAFHRLDQFRGEASFRSWLLQITHNTALNAIRSRVPEPVEQSAADEPVAVSERQPAAALEESERRERLEAKLGQLRSEHRAVLVLRDLEGLPYDEIAAVTDSPLGSVKGRLYRARGELVTLLRRNTYDWDLPG